MKHILILFVLTFSFAFTAQAKDRMKVFKSQKGMPFKKVMHEFNITLSNAASITLSDGETAIAIAGRYRYSFNRQLQIEGRLGIVSGDNFDATTFGGGAIYNFGDGRRLGNQFFGGGGLLIQSGDLNDDTIVYLLIGRRFALTRHLSYAPYVEGNFPSDSDSDSSIAIIPFALSGLF